MDGLLWLRGLAAAWLKWGLILGVAVGLFVAAAVVTGRDIGSGDCDAVSPERRAVLDSLREPQAGRSVRTTDAGRCRRGVFAAPVDGLTGDLDQVVATLEDEGWQVEGTLLPLEYDLRVRCLRLPEPGWEAIELNVAASRAGLVSRIEARATDADEACRPYSCRSLTTGCERHDRLES